MVCAIKICSKGGATYIICEIIVKDNLNIENLMQNLLKSSSPKLLKKILRYYMQIVLEYVLSNFVQMVVPPTLLAK